MIEDTVNEVPVNDGTTDLYGAFATNKSVEQDGIWITYGKVTRIRIARAGGGNTAFSRRYEVLMRPYKRLAQTDNMDKEVLSGLMRQLYAECVVKAWEGVKDRTGTLLPFTVNNCVQLFQDLPDLFDDLVANSMNATLYREEIREADAGN